MTAADGAPRTPLAVDTVLFDVDGTLVDTNYQHALSWFRAFRRHDITVPVWRIHRAIGMGGDQLIASVTSDEVEAEYGEALREAWTEEFDEVIDEVKPFASAHDLLVAVKKRGFQVVLASSGKAEHVERFLHLVDGADVVDAWTSSDDVENSKPEPDLVQTALDRVGGRSGVMIGDSTWDIVAAQKLEVPTIAVRTGGFSSAELTEAGAVAVFDSLGDLQDALDGLLTRTDP
ncbi:HAD family hydrolase [Microbacterium sp. 1P10UB]|uniref:HAD family hydrolase n=1 Tax=unclassified Microbacterium TaxID=2609290 RepID=UPI0039A2F93A